MKIYHNLLSFAGIFFFAFLAWLFSKNRRNLNWRAIFWGISLQLIFAFFIFYFPWGAIIFSWINSLVVKLLSFATAGTYFVFGVLSISPGQTGPSGETSIGFILAFQALPLVIFFSALMSLLYYFGIMQKIIKLFSYIFTKLMKVSGAESLCTASNIFVGIESAFTIRPYIEKMTLSELCTVLTAGMATIASTVMALYVGILKDTFPTIAGHLVSASILSAPAAIVISKLLYPEDGKPLTLGKVVETYYEKPKSWVEAVIIGSNEGVKLCVGIVALLLSSLALLAMLNWFVGAVGDLVGTILNLKLELSIEKILSYIYYPISFMLGIPLKDIPAVSTLLAERNILTELVSYQHLNQYISSGIISDPRTIVITVYSLCGFAHIASLAIFVGGLSAIAPSRAKDIAGLGFRSLFSAILACLMTGAIAGALYTPFQQQILSK